MQNGGWHDLYASDLQGVYSLIVVPALLLAYLVASGRLRDGVRAGGATRFVAIYAAVFAFETVVDPICTGILPGALGLGDGASSAVMLAFVLLGDFRVFALVLGLGAGPGRVGGALARAAAWTLLVPVVTQGLFTVLVALDPEVHPQVRWLIYELGFVAVALYWRAVRVPVLAGERSELVPYLRSMLAYVVAYYSLWATADVLILFAGLDAGWALRIVPNQLYYAFWVPVVYFGWTRGHARR